MISEHDVFEALVRATNRSRKDAIDWLVENQMVFFKTGTSEVRQDIFIACKWGVIPMPPMRGEQVKISQEKLQGYWCAPRSRCIDWREFTEYVCVPGDGSESYRYVQDEIRNAGEWAGTPDYCAPRDFLRNVINLDREKVVPFIILEKEMANGNNEFVQGFHKALESGVIDYGAKNEEFAGMLLGYIAKEKKDGQF